MADSNMVDLNVVAPKASVLESKHWMQSSSAALSKICEGYNIKVKKAANKGDKTKLILEYLNKNPDEVAKLQAIEQEEDEDDEEDLPQLDLLSLIFGQVKVSRVTAEILDLLDYTGARRPMQDKKGKSEKSINKALAPVKELIESVVEAKGSILTLRPSSGTMFQRLEKMVYDTYGGDRADVILVRKEVKPIFVIFGIKTTTEDVGDPGEVTGDSQSSGIPQPSQESIAPVSADRPGRLADEVATIKLALNAFYMRWKATFPATGKPNAFPGSFDNKERKLMRTFIEEELLRIFGDDYDYANVAAAKKTAFVDMIVKEGKMPVSKEKQVIQSVISHSIGKLRRLRTGSASPSGESSRARSSSAEPSEVGSAQKRGRKRARKSTVLDEAIEEEGEVEETPAPVSKRPRRSKAVVISSESEFEDLNE